MSMVLQQTLQGLCCGTGWNYAVFWKLKQCSRIVLIWEDGFHEFTGQEAFQGKLETRPDVDCHSLGTSVAKMSYHVYSFGEGLIGRVAFTGKHQWIFAPASKGAAETQRVPGRHALFEKYPAGWQQQFDAGIKTISVVAVPGGVVQLGSVNTMMEDLGFVSQIRSIFTTLQNVPGAFPSDLVSNMAGQMVTPFTPQAPQAVRLAVSGSTGLPSQFQGGSPPMLPQSQPMVIPPRISLSELTKRPPAKQLLANTAAQQMSRHLRTGGAMEGSHREQQVSIPQAGGTWGVASGSPRHQLLQQEGASPRQRRIHLGSSWSRDTILSEMKQPDRSGPSIEHGVPTTASIGGMAEGFAKLPLSDILYPSKSGGLPRRCTPQAQPTGSPSIDQIQLKAFPSGSMPWDLPDVAKSSSPSTSYNSSLLAGPALPYLCAPRPVRTQTAASQSMEAGSMASVSSCLQTRPLVPALAENAMLMSSTRPLAEADRVREKAVRMPELFSTGMAAAPMDIASLEGGQGAVGEIGHSAVADQLLASFVQDIQDSSLVSDNWLPKDLLKRRMLVLHGLDAIAGSLHDQDLGNRTAVLPNSKGINQGLSAALSSKRPGGLGSLPPQLDNLGRPIVGISPSLPVLKGNLGELVRTTMGAMVSSIMAEAAEQPAVSESTKRPWEVYMGSQMNFTGDELSEALGVGMSGQRLHSRQATANGSQDVASMLVEPPKLGGIAAEPAGQMTLDSSQLSSHGILPAGCRPLEALEDRINAEQQNMGMGIDIASLEKQAAEEAFLRTAGYRLPLTVQTANPEQQLNVLPRPLSAGRQLSSASDAQRMHMSPAMEGSTLDRLENTAGDGEQLPCPQGMYKAENASGKPVKAERTPPGDGEAENRKENGLARSGFASPKPDYGGACTLKGERDENGGAAAREEDAKKGRKRRRGKSGDVVRPRPRDRQQIQDRVKDLREMIPNTEKCSIDNLFEKAIHHLKFLQQAVNQHHSFNEVESAYGVNKRRCLEDALANSQGLDPFLIETLAHPPNHMLIEVLCDAQEVPLELADSLQRMGLAVRKGTVESRHGKQWARYIVEATREVQKVEVMWQLMQVTKTGVSTPARGRGSESPAGSSIMPSTAIRLASGPLAVVSAA